MRSLKRRSLSQGCNKLIENYPLQKLNTWGVGGSCALFAAPDSEAAAQRQLERCMRDGKTFYILGGGSNVLIQDGLLDAAVLHTANMDGFFAEDGGESVRLTLGPGVPVKTMLEYALQNNFGGLEFLTGIPGTLGGALWGNAGAAGVGFSELIESIGTLETDGPKTWRREDLLWEYRACPLNPKRTRMITSAVLVLKKRPADEILEKVRSFSELKKGQPLGRKTAGCVFKNPPGSSAGRLLDEAGCKGLSVGGATVSDRHANFIENTGRASARDIYTLSEMCRQRVLSQTGIHLEYEVRFFGTFEKA